MTSCASSSEGFRWKFDSKSGIFASETTLPCLVAKHGQQCQMCLGVTNPEGKVDIFDCKDNDNQIWHYNPAQENPPSSLVLVRSNRCFGVYFSNQSMLV